MSSSLSLPRSNAKTSWSWTIFRHTKFRAYAKRSKPVGAMLRYLPQYSPDLNPIEMPFSKLKADLRKAAERTVPRLCRMIGSFARRLSAAEAFNYFRHAGYAKSRPESALGTLVY